MTTRALAISLTATAVVLALAAVWVTAWAEPDIGVRLAETEGMVAYVLPGSPGWHDGIRPGQTVVRLNSGLDPGSWRLLTRDGTELYSTSFEQHLLALRAGLLVAGLGLGMALGGVVTIGRARLAAGLSALSVVLAAAAVVPSGDHVLTSVGIALSTALPLVWVAAFTVRHPLARAAALGAPIIVVGIWLGARYGAPALFDLADAARQALLGGGTVSVVVLLGDWRRLARRLWSTPGVWVDIAAASLIVGSAVLIALALDLPPIAVIGLLLPIALLYPRFRRAVTRSADRLLLEEVRDRASVHAVEDERSRIARDLHDAPLQEIAAAIRRLDGKSDTEAEIEILRSAAGHLRRLATELRPPVLDDLGLGAALSYVVDQARAKEPTISTTLELVTDEPLSERPPPEVELAVFRIVQEAVDNAISHSRSDRVEVSATVEPGHIRAMVRDWGLGITEVIARDAAHAGHLGLLSMQQRAALIGAEFGIEPSRPHGTVVVLEWRSGR